MRVLVDTSVWIEHLRHPQEELISLLDRRLVLTHTAIIGELACGYLAKRKQFLEDLRQLPRAEEASLDETLLLIERKELYGKGLGWIDIQILASTKLSDSTLLTYDKKLRRCADRFA